MMILWVISFCILFLGFFLEGMGLKNVNLCVNYVTQDMTWYINPMLMQYIIQIIYL